MAPLMRRGQRLRMKRMTTSRREDPESEPEKSPNKGLECNCHPRHGSCVRTSRATGASPLSPDVRGSKRTGVQQFIAIAKASPPL
jgi:hypothetical protein